MLYRTILVKNSDYKKTIHKCKTRKTAFINFNRIKEENNVLFKREFLNYNGLKPVKYKIYVVKDYEDDDELRTIRNRLGKLVEEKPIFDIWTILNDSDYEIEETFWVYGYDSRNDRKTIKDIISLLMLNMHVKKKTKQIVVVHNKLLIYDEEQFDMIICKCKKDAQRLHHALAKSAKDNKIKSLYFMGTANAKMISDYYDIIHEETGWPYTKIWRTTTRP